MIIIGPLQKKEEVNDSLIQNKKSLNPKNLFENPERREITDIILDFKIKIQKTHTPLEDKEETEEEEIEVEIEEVKEEEEENKIEDLSRKRLK